MKNIKKSTTEAYSKGKNWLHQQHSRVVKGTASVLSAVLLLSACNDGPKSPRKVHQESKQQAAVIKEEAAILAGKEAKRNQRIDEYNERYTEYEEKAREYNMWFAEYNRLSNKESPNAARLEGDLDKRGEQLEQSEKELRRLEEIIDDLEEDIFEGKTKQGNRKAKKAEYDKKNGEDTSSGRTVQPKRTFTKKNPTTYYY
jgi:chromosome segregation ATPase